MRLVKALRIQPGQVVAFVGAGGKSSAIAKLAHELLEEMPVVITTTTKLAAGQVSLAPTHLVAPGQLRQLPNLLQSNRTILITQGQDPKEPKLLGIEGDLFEEVRGRTQEAGAVLLVEADGARGLSLKVPAAHEPVIPPSADLVVLSAGLDILGSPLDQAHVHRPDRVAALLGLQAGALIDAGHVAAVLTSENGGLCRVPAGAEVRVLLNKAETAERMAGGRVVAERVLASPRIRAVLLGAVASDDPVRQTHGRVAGVVLAAGGSERLGRMKQLVQWRGKALVQYAIQAAIEGGLSPVVVVIGAEAEAVRQAIAAEAVSVVENRAWREGQSGSVIAGLRAVESQAEAVMFLLSDVPFVGGELVRALVAEHRSTLAPLIAPSVEGQRATPVLFDRVAFHELHHLEGDQGGRALFDRFPSRSVPWQADILFDIDTPDDLHALEQRA
ncbi:MAG: selenium cofactor biosynthesis protein YqeC [Anaerolineales bacterium]|jgi:molybdenum cofactor cytidylyltransferase